jgi:hypothetical protein
MHLVRPLVAADPRHFGRGPLRDAALPAAGFSLSDDLTLFATTFLAGFLFVSILIG